MDFSKTGDFVSFAYANRFISERNEDVIPLESNRSELPRGELRTAIALGNRSISINKYQLCDAGIDNPALVYRIVHDELQLNSKPTLNLATFVTTWMEDEAQKLAIESLDVNLVDQSIYPMTTEIQRRITAMAANLLHAELPKDKESGYFGTSTVGSSEAVMLGILAHKTTWTEWYEKLDEIGRKKTSPIPNLVVGGAYQVCWEKTYKFFGLEGLPENGKKGRVVPLDPERRVLTAKKVQECINDGTIDDSTVALGLVLGTTLTGEMDEIVPINEVVRNYNTERAKRGVPPLPIHVDGAYGGFVLPFTEPETPWDFRASEVKSINVSNHKFGMVYPGLGTVVFRNENVVPASLFTKVNYLGKEINDYSLNFSRSSFQVICQYYNFLRLGFSGYANIAQRILKNASALANELIKFSGPNGTYFELLTTHEHDSEGHVHVRLPNIVVKVNASAPFSASALSDMLKLDGWSVPAYTLPDNLSHVSVLRMVVKENFSDDMVSLFVKSMSTALSKLLPSTQANAVIRAEPILRSGRHVIC